jgi:hypothetical protein
MGGAGEMAAPQARYYPAEYQAVVNTLEKLREVLPWSRVITGTLDPHLARYPDDEWAQLATAQLTGVRATLAQLSK